MLSNSWKSKDLIRFSDFVEINPRVGLIKGKEYPCVMMEDITPGRRYVSSNTKRVYKGGAVFQTGDTLFARITPCLENGKIAQFLSRDEGAGFGSTEFFVFRHREGVSDPGYIFYLASSDIVRKPAEKSMFGASGRQRADLAVVEDLEVSVPPLPIQRKIAAILSAYDDLIENNMRRIAILEEMARLIYREWFVHFRFPGHEKVRILDSPLGLIPEEWRVACLDELFHDESGIVLTGPFGSKLHASDYRSTGVPLILVKHVKDGNIVEEDLPLVGEHKLDELERYRLRGGDIVVTRVGFVGESAYIHPHYQNWLFSGQMLRVRVPTNDIIHPRYLAQYYLTPAFKKMIENFAVGATRLSLNTEILSAMLLPVPPIVQQLEFVRLISPIDALAQSLRRKNANLRRTRDLLLPKLISGEVDVENVNVDTGGLL